MRLSRADLLALQPVLDATAKAIASSRQHGAGNVIWLSADFRSLLLSTGINFHLVGPLALEFVQSVLSQTCGGSVLVSAFNFDFPRTRKFVVETDPVQTGAFGQQLLAQRPMCRTSHPFYSFLVFGEAERELLNLPPDDSRLCQSMGQGSVFDWLIAKQTELITVGHHYVKSLTSVHHAEHLARMPVRYDKQFKGVVSCQGVEQKIECTFYVRELDVCDFSSLTERGDLAFRKNDLVKSLLANCTRRPLLVHSINHAPAHRLMIDDLQQGKNCYTDYFGPAKANIDVITGDRADLLYLAELKSLASEN